MLFYVLSVFCIAFGLSAGESMLPVTICKRNAVDYSACLKGALEEAWPRFSAGIPEYDFPSVDPFVVDYAKVELNSDLIHGELIISNLTAHGLSKAHFSDVRTHLFDDVFGLEIDVQIPKLFIKGAVKLNGSLNIFRLLSEGYFNLTVHDVKGTWNIPGHVVNDTWIVERYQIAPSVGKFKVYYDSSLETNKEFYNIVVNFINEFWPAVYRAVLPFLSNTWDPWLADRANKFFSKVPFSKVFP